LAYREQNYIPLKDCKSDKIPSSSSLVGLFNREIYQFIEYYPNENYENVPCDQLTDLAKQIYFRNLWQWKKEEEIRLECQSQKAEYLIHDEVYLIKKEIDISNKKRNELISRFDQLCAIQLNIAERDDYTDLFLNSETPGQMIDRFSILLLKIYFNELSIKTTDIDSDMKCNALNNLKILKNQLKYLSICYDRFMGHLINGKAYMCHYKQIKLYNFDDLKE
jgi:hypothetical protein